MTLVTEAGWRRASALSSCRILPVLASMTMSEYPRFHTPLAATVRVTTDLLRACFFFFVAASATPAPSSETASSATPARARQVPTITGTRI